MDRFFCSGSNGYLNENEHGDLVKRDDAIRALGFDKEFIEAVEELIQYGERLRDHANGSRPMDNTDKGIVFRDFADAVEHWEKRVADLRG